MTQVEKWSILRTFNYRSIKFNIFGDKYFIVFEIHISEW